MTIRAILVDDHPVVRNGFRALLEQEPDIRVIGEAENGRDALAVVRELRPDVVIMDVAMPGLNGIEAARQILREFSKTRILGLSMHPSRKVVAGMLRAGASGYVLKTCALEELVQAVRAVSSGKTYLSPEVAGGVVDDYCRQLEAESPLPTISPREREVLQLVAEGKQSKEIAKTLNISVKTVESHRNNIMAKLDIHSVAELTKYAIQEGLTGIT